MIVVQYYAHGHWRTMRYAYKKPRHAKKKAKKVSKFYGSARAVDMNTKDIIAFCRHGKRVQ